MNLSDTLVYNQANNIYFSTRDTIFISSLTEDYIYIVLVISAFEVYNKKHKSVFNKKTLSRANNTTNHRPAIFLTNHIINIEIRTSPMWL